MVDYYKILDVSRTSSSGDIKKAYRKLALKWHPDKNPDNLDESTKKFKEISEAYEVLIDERKRRVYDKYGKDGLQMPGGKRRHEDDFDDVFAGTFVFRDPEDVFREFFGGTPFKDLFGGFGGNIWGDNRHSHSNNSLSTSFFSPFSPFNFGDLIGNGGGGGGNFTSFSSINTFSGPSSGTSMKRTSTSTRFINGKKITTKKVTENGKETIMSYENDVLKSKTVNGVPQSITLDEASSSHQVSDRAHDGTSSHGGRGTKSHHDYPKAKSHHHSHSSVKHDKNKRK